MTENIEMDYQSSLNRLSDLSDQAIALGIAQGASQIEVVLTNGFQRTIEIKSNSISGVQQQSKTQISVRSYIDKKMGIASATSLTPNSIEEAVKNAVKLAKLSPEDEQFESLAQPMDREIPSIEGLFDPALATLDPSTVVEQISDLIQGATDIDERSNVSGKLNLNTNERVVANSLGVEASSKSTSMIAYSYVSIPVSPTDVGVGFEMHQSRNWDKTTDFYQLGSKGAEKSQKMLGAKVAPSKKMPVILDERATGQTLAGLIGFGVNGYTVMTGVSYFADKIGEELANSDLTIWDDPHVSGGSGSKPVDAEGTPTTRVDILTDGVLESYVTDSYTANHLGLENSGNAGSGFRSKVPRPRIHQMQIAAGTDRKEDIYEDLKEGLIIESGLRSSGGSPEVSAQINRGFYVKDGEIQYPVKNTMLGTNVFEFLKGITGISKELRVEFGRQYPVMSIDEVSIAGAGDKKQGGPSITMSSI